MMTYIDADDALAAAVVHAIQRGDVPALTRLLAENPGLATSRLKDRCGQSRTLLHVATDWPGHFPHASATVAVLVEAGADVHAPFDGRHAETPLHWAASSNDVEVLDALLDAGADIDAPGGVIGSGTPLADARGFGQWQAASRLIARGARPTLQDAATLGLMDHLEASFSAGATVPHADEITRAFWGACHGGQHRAAEYLLARGADVNWIGHDGMTALDVARHRSAEEHVGTSSARELVEWLRARGAKSAKEMG